MDKTDNSLECRARSLFYILLFVMLLTNISCETFLGEMKGEVSQNNPPTVTFSNVPESEESFSYAPVIHWKGRDSDGFVEYFEYADIIDSIAVAQPQDYIVLIPEEAWIRTESSSDTIFLLTEAGKVTEHVFYLKCVDDQGMESNVEYRTFFRDNHPPNVPRIKWFEEPDDSYTNDTIVVDTLYGLDKITDTWAGLGFNWKSSDEDDSDLITIPLQYRYFLEKSPHDTIWEWAARDWTDDQELQLFGLETGHYKLTVWARDDGLEMSVRPASIIFNVYKPSFEQSILILNCTKEDGREGLGDIVPGTQIADFYNELNQDPEVSMRYPGIVYKHFGNRNGDPSVEIDGLPMAFIGQFRLVIWISENMNVTDPPFETILRDYLRVGGRLWIIGSYVHRNILKSTSDIIIDMAESGWGSTVSFRGSDTEFVGAIPNSLAEFDSLEGFDSLQINPDKCYEAYKTFFDGDGSEHLLPGVDWIEVGSGAETVFYFSSHTVEGSGEVYNDSAKVVANVGAIYYPPTPLDCLVKLYKQRVDTVKRVYNVTRDVLGEVMYVTNNVGNNSETIVRVSYPSGEPWGLEDSIEVDLSFVPYSSFHYKPCAMRYEKISEVEGGGNEVRYRLAVFTFPLYYIENNNNQVLDTYKKMLAWFFKPVAG